MFRMIYNHHGHCVVRANDGSAGFARGGKSGFALIATLAIMTLLIVLVVGMLSLTSTSLRSTSISKPQQRAEANARMALKLALGELQLEMGPDMRVSTSSAILDQNEDTMEIDGVNQSQWLGIYDSWGDWLNDSYISPEGNTLTIQDTYTKGREDMFRRWLLSLPPDVDETLQTPLDLDTAGSDDWVTLVGEGSLGEFAGSNPHQVTRAYLKEVASSNTTASPIRGKYAWWIGSENQKAKATLAKNQRSLSRPEWETTTGNVAEVGVGILDGLNGLEDNLTSSEKLFTHDSLKLVDGVASGDVQGRFFDLTTSSKGVLASVRTGALKKDLSLLFERSGSSLPDPYQFGTNDIQEPSIRPMSSDLLAHGPYFPMRHFQSWTKMRHYYRMYRQSSDADTGGSNGTNATGSLQWQGSKPWTGVATMRDCDRSGWRGEDLYWRHPVAAKYTYIFSLMALPSSFGGRYELYVVYTPVVTYWNPYNVELRVPDRSLGAFIGAPRSWPISAQFFTKNASGNHVLHAINDSHNINYQIGSPTGRNNVVGWLRSGTGDDIVFKPGEVKVFSLKNYTLSSGWSHYDLLPGFDPLGIVGGDLMRIPRIYYQNEEPAISLRFGINGWVFNFNLGNTPGSLTYAQMWGGDTGSNPPLLHMHDWFRADEETSNRKLSESFTQITLDPEATGTGAGSMATKVENLEPWIFDGSPHPIAYCQMVLKSASPMGYESIDWTRKDWRSRNWIQSPPFYRGSSTYISEDLSIADTQRWDCPYSVNWGTLQNIGDAVALVDPFRDDSIGKWGSGATPLEQVSEVPAIELPTAPISSLAGFSGMLINPGWVDPEAIVNHSNDAKLKLKRLAGVNADVSQASTYYAEGKIHAYQSGVTGPGVGNSFLHPIIPRTEIHRDFDNSKSMDPTERQVPDNYRQNDIKLFRDYWDHAFLLNDALWDDYFLSSLATQTRPTDTSAPGVSATIQNLTEGETLPNSRYELHEGRSSNSEIANLLSQADGYLKAAGHLVVDGMFNVNSTSVDAWYALFAGIRERKAVYRDENGNLREIEVPEGKRIAITRFNTEASDQEMEDPELGAVMPSGERGWSGVRFLDDDQLRRLAEECVKQVKKRGPFLNYAEFINRRLSDDDLGTMGALQSAIDYDDDSPDPDSINYRFKNDPAYMIDSADIAGLLADTPEAATGSRFAGIPGYVIQSDILKPIGNTLSVRDDTFRIRAYGESLNPDGSVAGRAWCEAIVQRVPEYVDPSDTPDSPSRMIDGNGSFQDANIISEINSKFGRKMQIIQFRWLDESEI